MKMKNKKFSIRYLGSLTKKLTKRENYKRYFKKNEDN